MGVRARLTRTKLAFLSRLSATSGAPHRQCLFGGDFHSYLMRDSSAKRWSILTTALRRSIEKTNGADLRCLEPKFIFTILCKIEQTQTSYRCRLCPSLTKPNGSGTPSEVVPHDAKQHAARCCSFLWWRSGVSFPPTSTTPPLARRRNSPQWESYHPSLADLAPGPNDTLPFDHTLVTVRTSPCESRVPKHENGCFPLSIVAFDANGHHLLTSRSR